MGDRIIHLYSISINSIYSQPSPLALPDLPYVFLAKCSGGLWCGADLPESRVSVTPRSRLLGIQRSWNPRNRDLLSCQCNWNKQIPRISKFQLPETGRWVGKQERNSRFLSMSPDASKQKMWVSAIDRLLPWPTTSFGGCLSGAPPVVRPKRIRS